MPVPPASPPGDAGRRALTGDRDAFEMAVAPYQADLLAAAHRQLDLPTDLGPGEEPSPATDLTPEELVGETLLRAYERRESYDAHRMGLRAWLLGVQTRALARFRQREALYTQSKEISLDAEVPTGAETDAVEDTLYEFNQPFEVTLYEDIIAGTAPDDIDLNYDASDRLSSDELAALADARFDDRTTQAVVLHDEFEVSLPEVAQILNTSLKDAAEALNAARVGLRERTGSA
jgi:DNA-directed RNA polymerase specialized sigma24 family protein